jgi:uncharacterized protein YbaP (TraB family)
MHHALNWGKTYRGLETVEEQLAIFTMFSHEELVGILDASLTQLETASMNPMEELLRVYLEGEAVKLHEQINKHLEGHPDLIERVQQRLFYERDVRFAERIDGHLRAESDIQHFFAVGAGHLVIPGGVLDHLRARGYSIERQWNEE